MSVSPTLPRAKRTKIDRNGRSAALERLRGLKGLKNKYEGKDEVDNVYDTVDEVEYGKRVLERQQGSDWIEDDGDVAGYVEDGREIFDDDELEPLSTKDIAHGKGSGSRKRNRVSANAISNSKNSIRSLFNNVIPKKKEAQLKLDEDDALAGILDEIRTDHKSVKLPTNNSSVQNKSHNPFDRTEKEAARNYMNSFSVKGRKNTQSESSKKEQSIQNSNDDQEEILNSLTSYKPLKKTVLLESKKQNPDITHAVKVVPISDPKPTQINGESLTADNADDLDISNMDFSDIDYAENQFIEESNQSKVVENKENVEFSTKDDVPDSLKMKVIASVEVEKTQAACALSEEHLLAGWQTVYGPELSPMNDITSEPVSDLTDLNEKSVRIWWWDAWEDAIKRPGEVFLFGRVAPSVAQKGILTSCCVHVTNLERVLFLLPREFELDPETLEPTTKLVSMADVYEEFSTKVASKLNLMSYRTRKVTKNYAFGLPGVPDTSEYLEVRYEGIKPAPRTNLQYLTFSHIFGSTTTPLEAFLLDRKIKGPCWLDINNSKVETDKRLSWCKLELVCSGAKSVCVSQTDKNVSPPNIIVTTLNIRTSLNPKTSQNEVAMISCLTHKAFSVDKAAPNPPFTEHFCGFTRPANCSWPLDLPGKLAQYKHTKTHKCDTESQLLKWFLEIFFITDADLVVTHDALDCQLELLCHRIASVKLPHWSKIGRLRMSSNFGKKTKDWFIGRMICDVKLSAEELIKSRSYDLDTLCVNVLKIKPGERVDISNEDLMKMYETADGLLKLISLTMQDASYVLRLMCELNVLPLALQITNIAGNLMSRTLQGGRSERNEFLLLHAFTERNYIVPDKRVREWNRDTDNKETTLKPVGRKKPAYAGGLVLEPKKGFYDKYILVMDFNSLYPSIIQEYNICFTTVTAPDDDSKELPMPDKTSEPGVLPMQIRRLVESRREVKKLMANHDISADLRMQYNIRQTALKLTANSMYGCLGFSYSRFYAQHLAALVTQKGRDILVNTKELVQKLEYEVIYGDTDSIMINTNCQDYDQVLKIGSSIKQAVNKMYKQVELDIDGVFKYLLLLKKKKYAAVTITKNKQGEFIFTQEHKGLDIVRRDWSQISVMAGRVILDEILTDNQADERIENIHSHLEKFRQNLEDGSVPLPLLTISKQLTKAPGEYANTQSLPHVQVAVRMNSTHNKRFKKGDMIPYVICEDGTENSATQRAYHADELKASDGKLKIDIKYYLAHQIHPVVTRLCEPIEGTDASRIASCLGLDPTAFKVADAKLQRERDESAAGEKLQSSNYEKYSVCEKFSFKCIACKTLNYVATAFKCMNSTVVPILEHCSNPDCSVAPYEYLPAIQNVLALRIREFVRKFYENWMLCDEPSCSRLTRIVSHFLIRGRPACLACEKGMLQRQYTENELYMQLNYFQYIFDLQKHDLKKVQLSVQAEQAYNGLKETVDNVIICSEYSVVKLSTLFSQLHPVTYADRPVTNMELVDF